MAEYLSGIYEQSTVEIKEALSKLAISTAQAIGARFVSVDIIESDNSLKVIEINSGIMIEKAPLYIPNGREKELGYIPVIFIF